jgi:hypothetical protein
MHPRQARPLLASLLAASALGWSACEPLDLALFPVTPDASAPPLIDIPSLPSGNGSADAGGDGGVAPPPPSPSPCVPGAAACEACLLRADCSAGEVCHPRTGNCVPPCADGAPRCSGALVCSSLGVCVECENDEQCASNDDESRCALRGECVECLTGADCTDDPLERPACLADGSCGCASNADCSGGALCQLDEAHCEIEDD